MTEAALISMEWLLIIIINTSLRVTLTLELSKIIVSKLGSYDSRITHWEMET